MLVVSFANWRWLFMPSLLILLLLPFYRKYLEHESKETPPKIRLAWRKLTRCIYYAASTRGHESNLVVSGFRISGFNTLHCTNPCCKRSFYSTPIVSKQKVFHRTDACISHQWHRHILIFFNSGSVFRSYHLDSNWIGFAMVPAAAASSILGRKGGKLADLKGNSYLFSVASASLIICFVLLSIFSGILPLWISFFLMFGNVGQSFLQIAMANSISRSLPKDQVGVGMGLFSMISFIAQGMAAGVYGIVVTQDSSVNWNPLHVDPNSYLFSNIYLVLAVMHVGILLFYRLQFRTKNSSGSLEH